MNLQAFLDHWKIVENPFRGEEARQDPVFMRIESAGRAANAPKSPIEPQVEQGYAGPGIGSVVAHGEFEKIAGDFDRPSSAIVFGEKGSGKTAIRLQLADRVADLNSAHPASRCLWVSYDDWNPSLTRFVERVGSERKPNLTETLGKFRLVDHIDAILLLAVPPIVDALIEPGTTQSSFDAGLDARKTARKLPKRDRQSLMVLQTVYDRHVSPGGAEVRTRRLRRALRLPPPIASGVWSILAFLGWIPAAGVFYYAWDHKQLTLDPAQLTRLDSTLWTIAGLLAIYLVILLKRSVWDRLRFLALAHRLRRQVRVSTRSDASFGRSLRHLEPALLDQSVLPLTPADETRYAMLDRLHAVLQHFGYSTMMVVVDRVDEPSLIAGDPERMRLVVWPMLSNKFLQQPWVGIKMLLPMELRHVLFRESAAFFQEARLDKQNLIERLTWTGSTLYDLCNARLQACRQPGAAPISLMDMFAEDVTRQDLTEALEQVHQPRDAFKLLYQCMSDHCASTTSEQPQWRISRLMLDMVRKQQVERVKQLHRGVRPA